MSNRSSSFPMRMKWDTYDRVSNFHSNEINAPFTWKERDKISQNMTVDQIINVNEFKV